MDSGVLVGLLFLSTIMLLNLGLTFVLIRKLNRMPAPMLMPEDMSDVPAGLEKGTSAPDFQAETASGELVTLANFARKTVSMVFLSYQCPPCVQKLAALQSLASKARQAGVELVLVFGDPDRQRVRDLIEKHKVTLPVLIAPYEQYHLVDDYKANITPTYITINEHGVVEASGLLANKWEQELASQWTALQAAPRQQLRPSLG